MTDTKDLPQCESRRGLPSRAAAGFTLALGAVLVGILGTMAALSPKLEKHAEPGFDLLSVYAGAYFGAGLAFLAACWLVMGPLRARIPFAAMLGVGLATRLVFAAAPPILEDDWYRYLLDGALAAQGLNPFAHSPEEIASGEAPPSYLEVAAKAPALVLERINHPEVRTIYPPLAQVAFALAHMTAPWSPFGLRFINFVCDAMCAALLLLVLRASGRRSELWIIYGWNPLVARELINALHMDVLMLPLFAWALLSVYRRRELWAWTAICLAAAVKIWPAILLVPLGRQMLSKPKRAATLTKGLGIATAIAVASAVPIWAGGFEDNSGFVQYARVWENNDFIFRQIRSAIESVLPLLGVAPWKVDVITRRFVAGVFLLIVGLWHLRPAQTKDGVAGRMTATVLIFYLMSPTQFPWYFAWVLPFLAVRPLYSPLLYVATMAVYPFQYPLENTDGYWIYTDVLIPAVHLPVLAALAFELHRKRASQSSPRRTMSDPNRSQS